MAHNAAPFARPRLVKRIALFADVQNLYYTVRQAHGCHFHYAELWRQVAAQGEIVEALERAGDEAALKPLRRNSPLSMAATLAMVKAARGDQRMQDSLSREYRFTHRATADGDFLEGVRAQIIDKDRKPRWMADASPDHVAALLASLGPHELTLEETA